MGRVGAANSPVLLFPSLSPRRFRSESTVSPDPRSEVPAEALRASVRPLPLRPPGPAARGHPGRSSCKPLSSRLVGRSPAPFLILGRRGESAPSPQRWVMSPWLPAAQTRAFPWEWVGRRPFPLRNSSLSRGTRERPRGAAGVPIGFPAALPDASLPGLLRVSLPHWWCLPGHLTLALCSFGGLPCNPLTVKSSAF